MKMYSQYYVYTRLFDNNNKSQFRLTSRSEDKDFFCATSPQFV